MAWPKGRPRPAKDKEKIRQSKTGVPDNPQARANKTAAQRRRRAEEKKKK